MREPLISVIGAWRTYRMGEVPVHALRDATLDVRAGELLVILGPSGSGKSTLLNLIGGMDRATAGQVLFRAKGGEPRDLARMGDRELTLYRRHHVGFVFQLFNLVPMLTAVENVEVAAELARDPMDPREALRLVGLEERAGHFPSQLSGGEQQRVAIARALVTRPGLLLCDEPTGSLDVETGRRVLALLSELRRTLGTTVVIITHNSAIAAIADRVAEIRDGHIRELRENPEPLPALELAW